MYKICADLYGASRVELGIYESSERAKEVLDEIVAYNAIIESTKLGIARGDVPERFRDMQYGCYDMPAE